MFSDVLNRLVGPFTPREPEHFAIRIAIVRILFALVLTHKYANNIAFAVISPGADEIVFRSTIAVVLGLLLFIGFLTPLVLAGWLVFLWHFAIMPNLGDQAAIIVLWGLLLGGAGRLLSLDSLLVGWSRLGSRIISKLYVFALDREPKGAATVSFLMVALYWGLGTAAMAGHFVFDLWKNGRILELITTLPYYNDFYGQFAELRETRPVFFWLYCRVGWFLQSFWELFLLPLMYWRLGRNFAMVQGLLFFVASIFTINLGYLPFFEVCWWLLVFAPVPSFLNAIIPKPFAWSAPSRKTLRVSYSICVLVFALSLTFSVSEVSCLLVHDSFCSVSRRIEPLSRYIGQRSIDVFNQAEVDSARLNLVMYETDGNGSPLRIVPYLDNNGGRLAYMRNDLLYYGYSIWWQRAPLKELFADGDFNRPEKQTLNLTKALAILDSCLRSGPQNRLYEVAVFKRDRADDKFLQWGPSEKVGRFKVPFDFKSDLKGREQHCRRAFRISPPHFLETQRTANTLGVI